MASLPPALWQQLALRAGDHVRVTQAQGAASAVLPALLDATLAENVVRVPAGHPSTATLGRCSAPSRSRRRRPMFDTVNTFGTSLLGPGGWPVIWTLIKIVAVLLPLLVCVAYLTLWERKAIGWTQIRPGPNRVGPFGLLQPIADAVKLIFKEIIPRRRPTRACSSSGR